ncbi:redox-regulated ATPase YchF [Candidatus Caldatribacterium sp.]|uniref:redox-regulated ATPase YchF n=1 Tax=Candidatus Caldatribacterium sp. TaxID=2282143 RepID=UPI00299C5973|nr:redox-regulated ATPase YchF [Candidatus Caldatribacterium sp.]MDW8080384.1 redox-regulated ATPase YchF [Candidatus Calescibacterium sp.]
MGLQVGIVGLPNSGKTTLFNLLTRSHAEVARHPFSTITPNRGVVEVPDERLDVLARILRPPQVVRATVEFVDVAGLVEGASKGEGLGNQFLSHIRAVDAVVEVLRFFKDARVPHVMGRVDPIRDRDVVDTELLLADLEVAERRFAKLVELLRKTKNEKLEEERTLLERCVKSLSQGIPLRSVDFSPKEQDMLKPYQFLTVKPILYVANLDEEESSRKLFEEVAQEFQERNLVLVPVWAKLEEELAELEEAERQAFLQEFGIARFGSLRLVEEAYRLLGLITFYTYGDKELRAREILRGTKAPQAAGKVHSDMEKGFIRAEVIHFDDLVACGSFERAREEGKVRFEGKDYEIQDGDIVYFRFTSSR